MESNLLFCDSKQKKILNDLNKLIEIKTKDPATRSRARWMECGEKNTKYFLHLDLKLVYKATYLPVTLPQFFIKELNQIIYKFFWAPSGKRSVVFY